MAQVEVGDSTFLCLRAQFEFALLSPQRNFRTNAEMREEAKSLKLAGLSQ